MTIKNRRVFLLPMVGLLLLLCSIADNATAARVTSVETSSAVIGGDKEDRSPDEGNSALSVCSTPYPGDNGFAVTNWPIGHETFYVLKSPLDTDCPEQVPFGITEVRLVLYHPAYCSTNVRIEIYDATDDACPMPGDLLFSTPLLSLVGESGPAAQMYSIGLEDTICVWDDFFLSYTFPDTGDCFQYFLDQDSAVCQSYNYYYPDQELVDLAEVGAPGQVWMQAIGLDSTQSGCGAPAEDTLYTIPDVFENIGALLGQTVRVYGEYASGADSKLVTSFGDYMADELMPPQSILFLTGTLPDSAYWYGGAMIVTGTISAAPNPFPVYDGDSLYITINASSYEYLLTGSDMPGQSPRGDLIEDHYKWHEPADGCDSCKFAILVSGGGNAAGNKPSYWNNIEELYKHKTKDTASGGEGYCPANVEVIYFDGNSGNPAVIPHDQVDSATQANVQKAHNDIAKKIADCHRRGKPATVQKLFTNHGTDDSGAVLLGHEYLNPDELREMQQELIDSCCRYLYDEFLECYGGDMVDSMRTIDDKGKTEIHSNSAAGNSTVGWSSNDGVHEYLKKKIARLEAGDDYESAVDSARSHYIGWLEGWIQRWRDRADSLQEIIDTMPPGAARTALEGSRDKDSARAEQAQGSADESGPSWVRLQFEQYCDWRRVVVPPNGQIHLEYEGSGGCGNTTVYEETPSGGKVRVRTFNWNLPGGIGFQPGRNHRYLNGDADGTVYWIHNDNGKFTMTVDSWLAQDSTESVSNRAAFAGGSIGGDDASYMEFGFYNQPEYNTANTFADGFSLMQVPAMLSLAEGVGVYTAQFEIPELNDWWTDMDLYFDVLELFQPGVLVINCPLAQNQFTEVNIQEPGTYSVHLGSLAGKAGPAEIQFDASSSMVSFAWDCWSLRTRVETSLGVDEEDSELPVLPSAFTLDQNFPNPFNPSTEIRYTLARSSDVRLEIFNVLGQSVRRFVLGDQRAGTYQISWDGRDNSGRAMPSGVYFYRIQASDYSESKKMLLLR